MSVKQSLVLDGEKGELVNPSGRMEKKIVVPESKSMAALKSHSEAERRRRERINAHLDTLRGLVTSNEKMDKATVLNQVLNEVKQLKKTAIQASEGLHIPMDTNEVEVKKIEKNAANAPFLFSASLCCEYQPDLLSTIRQAIDNLPVKLLKCEISTLGGRVKIVFSISAKEEGTSDDQEVILNSVRAAFSDILSKVCASAEYADDLFYPRKRPRLFYLDSACSSP